MQAAQGNWPGGISSIVGPLEHGACWAQQRAQGLFCAAVDWSTAAGQQSHSAG